MRPPRDVGEGGGGDAGRPVVCRRSARGDRRKLARRRAVRLRPARLRQLGGLRGPGRTDAPAIPDRTSRTRTSRMPDWSEPPAGRSGVNATRGCGVATPRGRSPGALVVHPSGFGSPGPRFKFGQPHSLLPHRSADGTGSNLRPRTPDSVAVKPQLARRSRFGNRRCCGFRMPDPGPTCSVRRTVRWVPVHDGRATLRSFRWLMARRERTWSSPELYQRPLRTLTP